MQLGDDGTGCFEIETPLPDTAKIKNMRNENNNVQIKQRLEQRTEAFVKYKAKITSRVNELKI